MLADATTYQDFIPTHSAEEFLICDADHAWQNAAFSSVVLMAAEPLITCDGPAMLGSLLLTKDHVEVLHGPVSEPTQSLKGQCLMIHLCYTILAVLRQRVIYRPKSNY